MNPKNRDQISAPTVRQFPRIVPSSTSFLHTSFGHIIQQLVRRTAVELWQKRRRWHVPIAACLVALLLNLVLFLGMVTIGVRVTPSHVGTMLGGSGRAYAAVADDCDDDDDDDDDDNCSESTWDAKIVSIPSDLIGLWDLVIRGSKNVPVISTLATEFSPPDPSAYQEGEWIEIQGIPLPGGSILATHIRIDNFEAGEIVVRLESDRHKNKIIGKYKLTEKATLLQTGNIYLFGTERDEQEVVNEIAQEEGVIWAEVNYVQSVPEDDGYKTWGWGGPDAPDEYLNQNAFQQIRWDVASRSYQGEGVVVAVLDTGIYTPHEQFVGKLLLPSLDVIEDDNDPSEVGDGLAWGHGTHVAGIIAAMAPAAKILPVRVLDENGRGNTFLLAYAIEKIVSDYPEVKVINLSLGTEFDSQILRDVIADALAQGVVVVAAVGNRGMDQIQFPAGYPDVIGVTALDDQLHKAEFANFGAEWVDIATPGVGIMSTMINEEGPGYATWSGTSMSTAFVSGAAVLVIGKMEAQTHTVDGVGSQLFDSGSDLDALNPDYVGQIGRLLDVSAALDITELRLYIPQAFR